MALILAFAAFACDSAESVPPEGSGATGAQTSSAGGGGSGGTGATGGEAPQGGGGAGGGAGGEGAGTPAPVTAPTELNNANGLMTGPSYRLSFQLGRPIHQAPASGPTHDLVCAAPTLANQ